MKSWNHLSFVNISPTLVIGTSMENSSRVLTTSWKPKKFDFFFKEVLNWQNWILSVPRVSVPREKKSSWLCQYQSYISNWYINGKVFTSTTAWKPKNLIFFFKKVRNWISPCILTCAKELKSHPSFVNISCTLVIDTSMERSSQILQHENPKKLFFFFSKKFKIEFCPYPECSYPEKRNHPGFVNISPT